MTPEVHELDEHIADVKRDAVALWRAMASGDHTGAAVIAANASCGGCVAVQAVNLGLVLVAEHPSLGPDGYLVLPEDERASLDAFLAGLLEDFR